MNVVGYIRVSTQGQVKEGYSLKYQKDEIKAYCEEQGLNINYVVMLNTSRLWQSDIDTTRVEEI